MLIAKENTVSPVWTKLREFHPCGLNFGLEASEHKTAISKDIAICRILLQQSDNKRSDKNIVIYRIAYDFSISPNSDWRH